MRDAPGHHAGDTPARRAVNGESTSRPSLVEFFALRRGMVGMLLMVVLVSMGEKFGERFLPDYLYALGGGALAVGLLGGLKNLLSALYSYPAGYVSHRLGYRRALLVFNLLSIAGYALVVLIPAWPAVIVGAMLFLSWSAVSLPATMALVGSVVPDGKRAMGVSLHSLVRRFPMAVGPLLGGLLVRDFGVEAGIRAGFLIAMAMAGLAIIVQQRMIAPDTAAAPAVAATPLAVARAMSPPLRSLLASDILIRFCEQIPDAFVIIWCMRVIASPVDGFEFGVLTAIEQGTAVLVYVPVAHWADRLGKRPFVLMTFVFFTLFPAALYFSHSFWPLAAAFVLRGLKEFGEAARKALILDLAPPESRALTFGTYYLIRDTIVSLAAFAGAGLWAVSPGAALWSAFAFGVLGTVWYAARGKPLDAEGAQPPGG